MDLVILIRTRKAVRTFQEKINGPTDVTRAQWSSTSRLVPARMVHAPHCVHQICIFLYQHRNAKILCAQRSDTVVFVSVVSARIVRLRAP